MVGLDWQLLCYSSVRPSPPVRGRCHYCQDRIVNAVFERPSRLRIAFRLRTRLMLLNTFQRDDYAKRWKSVGKAK